MNKKYTKSKKWNKNEIQLFIMALCGALFLLVFVFIPMFGIILAFKDGDFELNILEAILYSDWVGFDNFKEIFRDPKFGQILLNTLAINLLMLFINFPITIFFALLINEIKHSKFKKTIQTIANFPHFISWIIYGGIILIMLNLNIGVISVILTKITGKDINLSLPKYFWGTMVITSLIKGIGWGSIIYLAAIAVIDPQLYEAAQIDGSNRFRRIWDITLPAIKPTIVLFLILTISGMLNSNFEQIYIFQNAINLSRGEVLATYIYKVGIMERRYSFVSAVSLISNFVSISLLSIGNYICKKISGKGIF